MLYFFYFVLIVRPCGVAGFHFHFHLSHSRRQASLGWLKCLVWQLVKSWHCSWHKCTGHVSTRLYVNPDLSACCAQPTWWKNLFIGGFLFSNLVNPTPVHSQWPALTTFRTKSSSTIQRNKRERFQYRYRTKVSFSTTVEWSFLWRRVLATTH